MSEEAHFWLIFKSNLIRELLLVMLFFHILSYLQNISKIIMEQVGSRLPLGDLSHFLIKGKISLEIVWHAHSGGMLGRDHRGQSPQCDGFVGQPSREHCRLALFAYCSFWLTFLSSYPCRYVYHKKVANPPFQYCCARD